ncbi:DNA cytosine methyltransferase [Nostoc commune]|uniref:DNA cytosine methyltransferase n=1 Tax=Nostoc commune TaxID=1178 RepID=UPI0018C71619|nr:DNA cytosine methyltransferase [Nostoc commune]MBG1259602.1 DNA cytosine methyltransferase [Nostoc commune BAE]MBG1262143.1 DNA cytosine methyltransferase [Nostoc commune BAE]
MIDPITPFKTQKVLDLCSGIGGFTLGHLISGGFETVAFCEINQYCQQILNLRFPQIPIIGDIHDITVESLARIGVGNIDGIIAGLPCPPFSLAGKRQASQDERNLFGEFFRVLCEVRPKWAIVENVPGLLTAEGREFFRALLWQFAQMGFDVEWGVLSAYAVGAVHKRERVWIIATNSQSAGWQSPRNCYPQAGTDVAPIGGGDATYAQSFGKNGADLLNANALGGERQPRHEFGELGNATHANCQRLEKRQPLPIEQTASAQSQGCSRRIGYSHFSRPQPSFSRGDDGFPALLDRCLLTHTEIDSWLTAATIPTFNRLTRGEIAALPADSQEEYRQL